MWLSVCRLSFTCSISIQWPEQLECSVESARRFVSIIIFWRPRTHQKKTHKQNLFLTSWQKWKLEKKSELKTTTMVLIVLFFCFCFFEDHSIAHREKNYCIWWQKTWIALSWNHKKKFVSDKRANRNINNPHEREDEWMCLCVVYDDAMCVDLLLIRIFDIKRQTNSHDALPRLSFTFIRNFSFEQIFLFSFVNFSSLQSAYASCN